MSIAKCSVIFPPAGPGTPVDACAMAKSQESIDTISAMLFAIYRVFVGTAAATLLMSHQDMVSILLCFFQHILLAATQ